MYYRSELMLFFFFSSRRRHTRLQGDWSSDVCSSDLESDARTDKYMKLFEKYEGHPDREKIVAREMGWTWLEEALEADERGALPKREREEIPPLEPNPLTEGVEWVRDKDGHIHHPLTKRAFESGVAMWHFCDDRGRAR